jgi:hypothetical protein
MLRKFPVKRRGIMIHDITPGSMDGKSLSEERGRGEEGRQSRDRGWRIDVSEYRCAGEKTGPYLSIGVSAFRGKF